MTQMQTQKGKTIKQRSCESSTCQIQIPPSPFHLMIDSCEFIAVVLIGNIFSTSEVTTYYISDYICWKPDNYSCEGMSSSFDIYLIKPKRALTSHQGKIWRSLAQRNVPRSLSCWVSKNFTSSDKGDQWWVRCIAPPCFLNQEERQRRNIC